MRAPRTKSGPAAMAAAAPPPALAADPVAARGEMSITLEGETYTLTPSFDAIGQLEAKLSLSLSELQQLAGREMLTSAQAGEIVTAFIRAHGRANNLPSLAAFDAGRIGQLIYGSDGGLALTVRAIVAPVLTLALYGGYTPQGNRKP